MKNLSDCRVLLVDDAKANLDILVEGLKADHKLSLALNGGMALQKVRAFAGTAPQSDDIAILTLKVQQEKKEGCA